MCYFIWFREGRLYYVIVVGNNYCLIKFEVVSFRRLEIGYRILKSR